MRLGILFNCQHAGLAQELRRLLPAADVISHELGLARRSPERVAATAAELSACDAVITSGAARPWGPLATDALRATARRLLLVPAVTFSGYHPDTVAIVTGGGYLGGPTGLYHSRLAVAGYLAGLSPDQNSALYNRLAFARLGYLDAFDQPAALLAERYAAAGIDLAPHIRRWAAGGCFMHSMNHPKAHVLHDVARIAAGLLSLRAEADAAPGPDLLAHYDTHPIYAPIAAMRGIQAEPDFKPAHEPGGQPATLSLETFLHASHAAFVPVPAHLLRAVDGMAAALAALGLADRLGSQPGRSHLPVTRPRIGVLHSVQARALSQSLQHLLPDAEIVSYQEQLLMRGGEAARAAGVAQLAACDAVLSAAVTGLAGQLAAMPGARVLSLPPVVFAGFHPDTIHVARDGGFLRGPTDLLHSRVAIAGYLAGLPPGETAALFADAALAGSLGYLDAFATARAELMASFAGAGIELGSLFEGWCARGCFMHTPDQPKHWVLLDLARLACERLGLTARPGEAAPPPDLFAQGPAHPVPPPVAAALGLPAEPGFRPAQVAGRVVAFLSPEAFVEASYEAFRTVSNGVLIRAPGLERAMAIMANPKLKPGSGGMPSPQPSLT